MIEILVKEIKALKKRVRILEARVDEVIDWTPEEHELPDETCKTCRGLNGKHSSLCGDQP